MGSLAPRFDLTLNDLESLSFKSLISQALIFRKGVVTEYAVVNVISYIPAAALHL